MEIYSDKAEHYFSNPRADILALIPQGVGRLLDIGCGDGSTSYAYKQAHPGCNVTGIELTDNAASVASTRLDTLIQGNIELMEDSAFASGQFDCILCADVLEHLVDPWRALEKIRYWLSDTGILIVSLPNIAHVTSVLKIIFNKLEYEQEGIWDKTHLRFFTLHTMQKMFAESGFAIQQIGRNISNSPKFKLLNVLSLGMLRSLLVFQYRFILTKRTVG